MRGRTVLVLLILVVGLVAFIELYEHKLPSSEERAALEKLVLNVQADEITVLDLAWGDRHVRLERVGASPDAGEEDDDSNASAWRLSEPLAATADSDFVASLIESLITLEKGRILPDSSRDSVGLNPPRLVVTLGARDRDLELWVGSDVPAGNSMIVTTGEDAEVVVVDSTVWTDLTRQPGDWRSRVVLDVGQERIERVTLENGDRRLELARRGTEFWLESPLVDLADTEKVEGLLAELAAMRVASFADELPAPIPGSAFDPPDGRLEIATAGGEEALSLDWGEEAQGLESQHYVRVGNQTFSTQADLQQFFDTPVSEWRSLELTSLESFEIDALEVVQMGLQPMILSRDGANWARDDDEISFTSVSDLLYAITEAQASSVMSDSTSELPDDSDQEPLLMMVLEGEGRRQTLRFSELDGEGARVWVDDREVFLIFGSDEFTEILAKVDQVRNAIGVKTSLDEQLSPNGRDLTSDQQR